MITCPRCGQQFRKLTQTHKRACRKRPPAEELRQLRQQGGVTLRDLSQLYEVSKVTIKSWLVDFDIDRKCFNPQVQHVLPLAEVELAPLWGQRGNCERCGQSAECWRRMNGLDLWPLCQVPTRRDVALAYVRGRIGFDGNLPEWLPEVVREIRQ